MVEEYSSKAGLHIGIVDIICGVISIAVGAFSTRNDDHTVITEFKPKGLPIWAGILFVITGGLGILSFKNPRKCIIIFFMVLSAVCIGAAIISFWCLLPLIIAGEESIPWNLSYGSFLALTAIVFVITLNKALYVCFKSNIMYCCNCVKRRPPRERQPAVVELGAGLDLSIQYEQRSQRRYSRPTPSHRGASGSCRSQRQHTPYSSSDRRRRSRDRYRDQPSVRVTQIEQSRERIAYSATRNEPPFIQHVQRPPPPPPAYQTIKFPYLPSYSEVEASPPPPPYTEK